MSRKARRTGERGLYRAPRRYRLTVKTVWQGRASQAAAKYGEHAPMATTCCNASRTCVQTNAIAAVLAVGIAVGAGVARFGRRLVLST